MTIAYCPLDEEPPVRLPPKAVARKRQQRRPEPTKEDTEVNYLVLFFLAGTVFLALTDSMKK
jgi:hypothetical protein